MPDSTSIGSSRLRPAAALFARIATVSLLLFMFWLTHMPIAVKAGFTLQDKVFHFTAFMTLTYLLLFSWEFSIGILQPKHYFAVFLFCTLYGAIDELTQTPFGRVCDFWDWLADVVGTLVGLALYLLLRPLVARFF